VGRAARRGADGGGTDEALNRAFARDIREGLVVAFGPPAIPGLGTGAGFTLQLQDRSGGPPSTSRRRQQRFMDAARKRPEIGRISTLYRAAVPQIFADIDRSKVLKSGVRAQRREHDARRAARQLVRQRLQPLRPRLQGVRAGRAEFRRDPSQLGLFYVRNQTGGMVPLDTLLMTRRSAGPEFTNRFNLFRAAELTGVPAPGYSSAQALDALEETARSVLPPDMSFDWADMSYQERKAPGVAVVFALAIFLVFLILAAQYESWACRSACCSAPRSPPSVPTWDCGRRATSSARAT
jgi:HAE1 family hydrophobic/amphiphilic exporter-1